MVGQFKKTYLHKPFKILQLLTTGTIQKYLTYTLFLKASGKFGSASNMLMIPHVSALKYA